MASIMGMAMSQLGGNGTGRWMPMVQVLPILTVTILQVGGTLAEGMKNKIKIQKMIMTLPHV